MDEKILLEVDGDKLGEIADSPLLVGMMSAGAEDRMFKKYSMDSSPGLRPEETKKEESKAWKAWRKLHINEANGRHQL